MCKVRVNNCQHYIRLDYDWLNVSDRKRLITLVSVYEHLFEHSRASHCLNDKCPSKNVRRYTLDLTQPAVSNNEMFKRQLKKFITDVTYYNTLLGFSMIVCDKCQHWGVEWKRVPNPYLVKKSNHFISAQTGNRGF